MMGLLTDPMSVCEGPACTEGRGGEEGESGIGL